MPRQSASRHLRKIAKDGNDSKEEKEATQYYFWTILATYIK